MDFGHQLAKFFLILGLLFLFLALLFFLIGKVPGLGRLPGDIFYHKGNFSFYFPLATCILLSLLLTLLLNLFFFFRR
ncbi:DUF2905 domain-containing protein [Desulfothermobacter acidiphilus]|uniref:DUF2905 domain-containing protein n=1 Tax=Desulfothermobacter acidiphilus TaxID=1938353 RepID=UPI003F8BBBAE